MDIDDPAVADNLGELAAAFAATDDPELIEAFLRSLLTPSETADVVSSNQNNL